MTSGRVNDGINVINISSIQGYPGKGKKNLQHRAKNAPGGPQNAKGKYVSVYLAPPALVLPRLSDAAISATGWPRLRKVNVATTAGWGSLTGGGEEGGQVCRWLSQQLRKRHSFTSELKY